METIREIVEVKEGKITLQLPESFTAKRVELIVIPAEETSLTVKKQKISGLRGKLARKNEAELDQKLQQLRDEWENDI